MDEFEGGCTCGAKSPDVAVRVGAALFSRRGRVLQSQILVTGTHSHWASRVLRRSTTSRLAIVAEPRPAAGPSFGVDETKEDVHEAGGLCCAFAKTGRVLQSEIFMIGTCSNWTSLVLRTSTAPGLVMAGVGRRPGVDEYEGRPIRFPVHTHPQEHI